jgi:hypothetical protein
MNLSRPIVLYYVGELISADSAFISNLFPFFFSHAVKERHVKYSGGITPTINKHGSREGGHSSLGKRGK